jgi:hypothetical protein
VNFLSSAVSPPLAESRNKNAAISTRMKNLPTRAAFIMDIRIAVASYFPPKGEGRLTLIRIAVWAKRIK